MFRFSLLTRLKFSSEIRHNISILAGNKKQPGLKGFVTSTLTSLSKTKEFAVVYLFDCTHTLRPQFTSTGNNTHFRKKQLFNIFLINTINYRIMLLSNNTQPAIAQNNTLTVSYIKLTFHHSLQVHLEKLLAHIKPTWSPFSTTESLFTQLKDTTPLFIHSNVVHSIPLSNFTPTPIYKVKIPNS